MESLFNMTRLAQLGVDIPQNLDDEFERISNVDLVDAPNTVDANIRLKSLLRKLEPTLTRLNTRRDEAQTALDKLRQHVTALIASDADGKGPEIRNLLARKSDKEIKEIYSRPPVGNPALIWAAMASPVAELVGIPLTIRKDIEQKIMESRPVFKQATTTVEISESEITSINHAVSALQQKLDASLAKHRQTHPGLMQSLEK